MPAQIAAALILSSLSAEAGTPRFEAPVRIEAAGKPIDVTTGHAAPYLRDMDGDGKRDLLVGEFGDGTYTGPVHEPGTPGHEWANGRLRIYRNHGENRNPRFEDFEYFQAGGTVAAVPITCCVSFVPQFIDYDNDGTIDVLSASYPGDMYLFKGSGDGTWAKGVPLMNADGGVLLPWKMIPEKYRKPGKPDRQDVHSTTAELHDLDADGDLDLLIGSRLDGCFSIENTGTRSEPRWSTTTVALTTIEGTPIGGWDYGSNVHVFDWDHDGASDILVGSEDGGVFWHRNAGADDKPLYGRMQVLIPPMTHDEMFAKLELPVRNGSRCKVHATDWDGDGLTDLLVGDFGSTWHRIRELTPEQVQERERIEADISELGEEAMPLWNADSPTPEQATRRDEIDVAMSQLYDRLETLETHRHDSHGWVWLYRQLPAATPNQESEPTATNTHGHVRMTCTASAPGTGDHRVRSIDVQFLVDRGWTIAPATGGGWSIPTELDVSLSKGYTVQSIDWPEPRQQKIDGVITSVYEGPITIKVQVAAETSPAPASCNYTIHGSWQACSTRTGICVRGSTVVTAGF